MSSSLTIPDDVYEYLARVVAYDDDLDKGDRPLAYQAADGRTFTFRISADFDPWFNGFDAYGVTVSADGVSAAVLACRGTSSVLDILDDADPRGVGFGQFTYNLDDVYDWCRKQVQAGLAVSCTGHSLGGALAQWFGAWCSRKLGADFQDLVTFNSPGITAVVRDDGKTYDFTQGRFARVCHYVNSGDVVSLAGRWFVDGEVRIYGSPYECGVAGVDSIDVGDYWLSQHSRTSYLIRSEDILPGMMGVFAIDSTTFSTADFSYLLLEAPAELAEVTSWQLVDFGTQSLLFNSEFAESILALTRVYGDLDLAETNTLLKRGDIEDARSEDTLTLAADYVIYDDDVNLNLTVRAGLSFNGNRYVWLDCGTEFDDLLLDCTSLSFSQLRGTASTASPTVLFTVSGSFGSLCLTADGHAVDVRCDTALTWRAVSTDGAMNLMGGTVAASAEARAGLLAGDANGAVDVLLATASSRWGDGYCACHVGSADGWEGTGETVPLSGRNRFSQLYQGGEDASVLLLTDDDCGDALALDDAFTAAAGRPGAATPHLTALNEILAGAGDDIVDLTSRAFATAELRLTVRGGDGDDVLWGGGGACQLFGDAGNDRLTGSPEDDLIVGGTGDDVLHGGGGTDVFCFGGAWGQDTVEQLAGGDVILWFAEEGGYWDSEGLVYADGAGNTVTVTGVDTGQVRLRYGAAAGLEEEFARLTALGAFAEASSTAIFDGGSVWLG